MALDFVLFDLDGVIVDSRVPISSCMNQALEALGYPTEPEASLHQLIGPPLDSAFRGILEARGNSTGDVGALVAAYRERYASISLTHTELMPGMEEALDRLRPHFSLGVATAKPAAFARPILETLGLAGRFEAITGPPVTNSHFEAKTRTVERAREAIGQTQGVGAMVGDRDVDVVAGRGNGLRCVTVGWGIGDDAELLGAQPDYHASTPEDLVRWLMAV